MPKPNPQQENPEDQHPFEKVFEQIDEILDTIEKNKNKPLVDLPNWVVEELSLIEKEFERLQKVASQTSSSDIDIKKYRKLMRQIPEEKRPKEFEVVEEARRLKDRTEETEKNYRVPTQVVKEEAAAPQKDTGDSPLNLPSKEEDSESQEIRANIERRKKFGRVGGRKNWKPL